MFILPWLHVAAVVTVQWVDLTGLQEDTNLAVNYMLSVKRSSDLKRQWAIPEFEASLHQQVAEEAVANEKAKIIHSRNEPQCQDGMCQGCYGG